jgi:hypothetical protein
VMKLTSEEYRHAGLMAAIIAIVPLLFFPNHLGLKLSLPPIQFFLIELAYYWIVFLIMIKGINTRDLLMTGAICFLTRLAISSVFGLLLLAMHDISFKSAFMSALYQYKPAMVLQVVSLPFILAGIFTRLYAQSKKDKPKVVLQSLSSRAESNPAPEKKARREDFSGRKIIGLKTPTAPDLKPAGGFDEAMRYVGAVAAVRFAVLIDERGLPVAFFGDDRDLRDRWAAVAIYVLENLKAPLAKAGDYQVSGLELNMNEYRLHIVSATELYLLVAADSNSEEIEKVRVVQAAEMIRKTYYDRYGARPKKAAREDNNVPSFS